MDKSIKFLSSLNIKNDYLIVGCSGGPDSMCLLQLLHNASYKIVCSHVNHNIRKESKEEYQFLKKYCEELGIVFEGLELRENEVHNEAYYRKKRYSFYKALADKYQTKYILTAHHGDDLIETVLMRISRGSNLKGYLGFQKIYDEGKYRFIKPLIYYNKEEIISYNDEHGIPYVTDSSNEQDSYTRNRYRHKVLPFLKSENENVQLKYLQYSEELENANDFIDSIVKKELQENYDGEKINLIKFSKLHKFIQKRELEMIFKNIYENSVDKLKVFHIETVLSKLEKNENFKLNFPLDIVVEREYNYLKIYKKESKPIPYKIELSTKSILPNGDIIEFVENEEDTSNYTIRLNTKEIKLPLYIRTKREGDRIAVKNMQGTKKIKNIFIDEKVPKHKRDTYPILTTADDVILWLPGLKKSKFDNEKNEKYDIILKYTQKGNF